MFLKFREIALIESSIINGRIYFPSTDIKFFPADAFADREISGHKGNVVLFYVGGKKLETDIGICSGKRISPRKSFAFFFREVSAKSGEVLKISRLSDREYQIEQLK